VPDDDDHYAVLGIDPHADEAEVRRAFHRLATKWHPDRGGADITFIFQRIAAAYAVLSDPVARAAYDRRRGTPPRPEPEEPPVRRRAPGVLIRRLSSHLDALLARGVARRIDGVIELDVEPEEVAEGGMITIPMSVAVRCPDCANGCERCGGSSRIVELFSAWLALPPEVADGALLRPSVQMPGVSEPVVFRVRRV